MAQPLGSSVQPPRRPTVLHDKVLIDKEAAGRISLSICRTHCCTREAQAMSAHCYAGLPVRGQELDHFVTEVP